VDTPFAWGEREPEKPSGDEPSIGEYFDGLLSWEPGDDR